MSNSEVDQKDVPAESWQSAATPRDFIYCLTDGQLVAERSDNMALGNLARAIVRRVEDVNRGDFRGPGVDLQIAFALLPGGGRLIEMYSSPAIADEGAIEVLNRLYYVLDELALPPVVDGPVAFFVRQRLWGGAPKAEDLYFNTPFSSLNRSRHPVPLDDVLWLASGPSLVWRCWRWLRQTFGPGSAEFPRLDISARKFRRLSARRKEKLLAKWDRGAAPIPIDELSALIKEWPKLPIHLWQRSAKYLAAGQWERTAADCTALIEQIGPEATVLTRRARALFQLRDAAGALTDLNAAIAADPDHVEARYLRAGYFLESSDWKQAESDLSVVVSRSPRSALGHVMLSRALQEQQRITEGFARLAEAVRIDPHNADTFNHLAAARIAASSAEPEERRRAIEQAVEEISRAIDINPTNVPFLLTRADYYVRLGEFVAAAADALSAAKLDNQCGPAFGIRGYSHQQLGASEPAISDCTRAIELGASNEHVYLARSLAYAVQGDLSAAQADAEAGLALAPQFAALHRCLGAVRLQQGEVIPAVESFNETIRLADKWPLAYLQHGIACRLLERFQDALADFQRVLDLAPDSVEAAQAYFERGMVRSALADYEAADADLSRSLERVPDASSAWLSRAWCRLQLHKPHDALRDLDRAIELAPDDPQGFFLRGQVRTNVGNAAGAIEDFNRLIELCPTFAGAYALRGSARMQEGTATSARADFQEAIKCDPSSAESIMLHELLSEAATHMRFERFDEAIECGNEALKMDPDCAPAHSLLGAADWYNGNLVEAIERYSLILNGNETSSTALSSRGQILAEMGEYEQALADLDRAIALGEENRESPVHIAYARSGRALALAGLARQDEALQELEIAVADCPGNAWLQYNLGLTYHSLDRRRDASICFNLALSLDDPSLPPRKRERARGFLRAYGGEAPPPAESGGASTSS